MYQIRISANYFYDVLSRLMSQSIPTGYIPPGQPSGLAQKTCPEGQDVTFESCRGPGIRQGPGFGGK